MGGVQVRGEWIDGRSFAGTRTFGGYADLIVHRPFMGPVTAVARAEKLDYSPASAPASRAATPRAPGCEWPACWWRTSTRIREPAYDGDGPRTSLDVALTFTARR